MQTNRQLESIHPVALQLSFQPLPKIQSYNHVWFSIQPAMSGNSMQANRCA